MSSAATSTRGLLGKMVLGRYRVLRHLADGGMGAIYLARNEGAAGFVRPVVVKALLPSLVGDDRMVDMFMREARIMSNLRHPSIVSVLEFATDGDVHLMVLDYVHGFHLGRWHKYITKTRGPFPVEIAAHVVLQVLRALHYAHTMRGPDGSPLNIVHRDVTPSNILIDVEGHTKLADFGIARMNTDKTEAGKHAIKGKFPYLAPEVLEGAEPSAQTDVYAVGVTLHEILLGRNEFRAPSIPAIISRVLKHEPVDVSTIRDDVSPALGDVIARALAKTPDDRFRSAADFADALAAARRLTEDEAARALADMAGEDFRDARMAEVLAVPKLDELESSWQTPTPGMWHDSDIGIARPGDGALADPASDTIAGHSMAILSDGGGGSGIHGEKTVALGPRAVAHAALDTTTPALAIDSTAPAASVAQAAVTVETKIGPAPAPAPVIAPSRPPWALIGMGVGLVGVGAIAVLALMKKEEPAATEPAYVVVDQREPAAVDAAAAATPALDAGAAIAPAAVDAAATVTPEQAERPERPDRPTRPEKPDTARELTRAFEREKARVQGCFDRHALDATGSPELAVRFKVSTDGKVADAQLLPVAIASTPLGGCILDVARKTKFPALDKPMTFRVPLRARVKP